MGHRRIGAGGQRIISSSPPLIKTSLSNNYAHPKKELFMRNGSAVFLAATLLFLPMHILSPAQAAAESPDFQKCMDAVDLGAFKMTQWTACYEAELKRQDRELNATYQKIQKAASPDLKQGLTKGQRAWIAYRDTWCSYEELTPVAPGGSVNKAACLLELTKTQIDRLKNSSID